MNIERIVGGFVNLGAFASVSVTLVGVVVMAAHGDLWAVDALGALSGARCVDLCASVPGGPLILGGLIALVAVSVGRLLVCAFLFLRGGDSRYALISLLTVALVATAALFGLAGA